jgi:DNA-binding NarL/FixJ family response regulator
MGIRNVNAAKVLSPELLAQVSDALGGGACNLWVPGHRSIGRHHRNGYVLSLHERGHSAADIAARLFISERTVWRILATKRAAGLPSGEAPGGNQE